MTETKLKRPNPLPPDQMTPAERRAELCGLLALGLVRSAYAGRMDAKYLNILENSCLHYPRRPMPSCNSNSPEKRMNEARPHTRAPGRAEVHVPSPELKSAVADDLFDSEPAPNNSRAYPRKPASPIASRNSTYGGLKSETTRRMLDLLGRGTGRRLTRKKRSMRLDPRQSRSPARG
jgi:hypothetical protein